MSDEPEKHSPLIHLLGAIWIIVVVALLVLAYTGAFGIVGWLIDEAPRWITVPVLIFGVLMFLIDIARWLMKTFPEEPPSKEDKMNRASNDKAT